MCPAMNSSPPDVTLYSRDGCHLCDETRAVLSQLLDQRQRGGLPTPRLVERDITSRAEWETAFRDIIPVVEVAGRRLELATSAARIERLLTEALDGTTLGAQ
jgi:hypothetical protein